MSRVSKIRTMGEAKRKRAAIGIEPCLCGSSKQARDCCYNGRKWHKPAASLGLTAMPKKSVVKKCYMKDLRSCGGGLSGEHLISKSVILVLKEDGDFSVSGLPWLPAGEAKVLGLNNFTANCLCADHNSALSPLDDSARIFFDSLKNCLGRSVFSKRYLISGHDIERWLLKTVKAFAVSGNLARGQQRLSGAFSSDIQVLRMLDNPHCWPEHTGLYCVMNAGDLTHNHNRFQLVPYTNTRGELGGLGVNIMGLDFVLMLEPPNISLSPHLQRGTFRPGRIAVTFADSSNWIELTWEDGRPHVDTLSLSFVRDVAA